MIKIPGFCYLGLNPFNSKTHKSLRCRNLKSFEIGGVRVGTIRRIDLGEPDPDDISSNKERAFIKGTTKSTHLCYFG
ncbi:hypothetical protein L1987_21835 [Smallanthus sonchifolius]|uniref:Uncharacterized protein n=1 Tax=Smallanthus sonchifolius TaxID=185202 RepID=A0ACB9IFU1_9ASTR|nr:hypothetical protein L1987_21835 [Smallanthus sonchifolius]